MRPSNKPVKPTSTTSTVVLLVLMVFLVYLGIDSGFRMTEAMLGGASNADDDELRSVQPEKIGMRVENEDDDREERLRSKLIEFMTLHNPKKLDTVDAALKKWQYDETVINAKLREKYGADLNDDDEEPRMKTATAATTTTTTTKPPPTLPDDSNLILTAFTGFHKPPPLDKHRSSSMPPTIATEIHISTPIQAIIVGLPETGVDVIRSYFEQALKMKCTTEDEAYTRLQHVFVRVWDEDDPIDVVPPNFEVFGDSYVVAGLASSVMFQEVLATYGDATVIVAVREIDAWWNDMKKHLFDELIPELKANGCMNKASTNKGCPPRLQIKRHVVESIFGSLDITTEFLWKKAYYTFYESVFANVPRGRRVLFSVYSNPDNNARFGSRNTKWDLLGDLFPTTHGRRSWQHPTHMTEDVLGARKLGLVDLFLHFHIPSWMSTTTTNVHPFNKSPLLLVLGLPRCGEESILTAMKDQLQFHAVSLDWTRFFDKTFACSKHEVGCELGMAMRRILQGEFASPTGLDKMFAVAAVQQDHVVLGGFPLIVFLDEILTVFSDVMIIVPVRASHTMWWKDILQCGTGWDVSMEQHGGGVMAIASQFVLGGTSPSPYVLQRKYQDSIDRIQRQVSRHHHHRLLFLDVESSSSWSTLCEFLPTTLSTKQRMACSRNSNDGLSIMQRMQRRGRHSGGCKL